MAEKCIGQSRLQFLC